MHSDIEVDTAAAPRPARISLVVGTVASVVLLFPSWVGGGRLPLQNLWHERTMPEDMPFSLLPLSQYYALSIFVMLLLGGVVAGFVVRVLRARPWPAALGVLLVQVIVTVQSFAVLGNGLGIADGSAGAREVLYFGGMLGGVLVGMLLAQVGCWMASRRTVALPALAAALSAVPVGSWIGFAIASFNPITGYPQEVGMVLRWVPAVTVAAALIWCGVRPLSRLVVWVVGLLALWVLPAVFTAVSYALGMRVLDGDLREMAQAAGQVFPMALGVEVLPVVVAAVSAVVGTIVFQIWRRPSPAGRE
ncbi:hypothetical protein FVO59_06465 [Microbacterium esteraromaticum]|uniref:Uncharacterized protein n=1 Tax=Microbacterium esteraromaticum TaxID=57043 RepID=A0A7D8ABP5_9MICO|nr:hypothetical protein [Microbacterium esteraromaticum]QMU96904.1 hypothetical protein FVO59_06465 [Microbacterium esteraromaticum]